MAPVERIVLSHPGASVFVQQAGRALFEAGWLQRFVTTIVDRPDGPLRRWARCSRWLDERLRRRQIREFPAGLAVAHPGRELLRLLVRPFDRNGVGTDFVWEWAERGFDAWVAREGLGGATAVYGFEHACAQTFRVARPRGLACIYEIPAPHLAFAQRMRDVEIAAHPLLDGPYEQRLRRAFKRRAQRRQEEFELADLVIASSEFTKSTYRASGLDVAKVRVVPLGAPPVCEETVLARREATSAERPLRFLCVGSFALHKGGHHLLAAWQILAAGPAAVLEIVGSVELPASFLHDCGDYVHFRGAVSRTGIWNYYREADVLVFPALCDGFGMVVTEAMSQGVPVITTPNAGAAELIAEGRNGWLVPPRDPPALCAAMAWCIGHRAEVAAAGRQARKTAAAWQWADYRQALVENVDAGLRAAGFATARPPSTRPKRPRICLLTPAHLSANPRLVKEADTLQASGFQVHVVAGNQAPFLRPYDEMILARAGWQCTLVGRGSGPSYAWRTLWQRVALRLLATPAARWLPFAVARTAHHRLIGALGRAAAGIPADLYIAHNLPALPAAAFAAKRNGAKLGFDAEDFHSGELTDQQESSGGHAARRILEAALLPLCDHLTAASPGIAEEYRRLYGVTMRPLLNVFPLAEAPERPADGSGLGEPLSLYWFSQTIGPGRGLEEIIWAMGGMRQPAELHLRGKPQAGYIQRLEEMAGVAGVRGRVHVLPVSAPHELIRASASFDLGLALEMTTPRNRAICLTNKIFAYLLAGLPVLLSRTPAQEALCAHLGAAARLVDLGDADAVAQCLDAFALDIDARLEARNLAWKLGRDHYNWDLEQVGFLQLIAEVLKPPVSFESR